VRRLRVGVAAGVLTAGLTDAWHPAAGKAPIAVTNQPKAQETRRRRAREVSRQASLLQAEMPEAFAHTVTSFIDYWNGPGEVWGFTPACSSKRPSSSRCPMKQRVVQDDHWRIALSRRTRIRAAAPLSPVTVRQSSTESGESR